VKKTLIALAIVAAIGASASAGATIFKDVPIAGGLPANACTGEATTLAGIAHLVFNDNGGHFKVSSVTATGVNTGTVWTATGSSVQHGVTTGGANGATVTTFVFRIRLRNNGDSFSLRQTVHTTVNANGDVTSDFVFDDVVCK